MILECLDDPIVQAVNDQLKKLGLTLIRLRDLRNQSPLMHGYRGIDVEKGDFRGEKTIKEIIRVGYRLLDFLIEQGALDRKEWERLQVVLRPYPYDPLALQEPTVNIRAEA
jgi:hypothetical protein